MEEKKDYSLLRPFDLEAAKAGEAIHDLFGGRVHFMDGPDAGGKFAVRVDGHFATVFGDQLRMAPLAWVEGKPVYKGDVLWHTMGGRGVVIDRQDDFQISLLYDRQPHWGPTGAAPVNLSWTPTKAKREIKLLAHLDADQLFWLREGAQPKWPAVRVPSEDKTVEVEEPAS